MPSAAAVIRAVGLVAAALGLDGCLYDPDEPCSAHQKRSDSGNCVCVAGAIPAGPIEGCRPCGDHEVAAGTTCTCAEGYARPDPGSPCAPVPAGLGAACQVGGPGCADATYDTCHAIDEGEGAGYCTSAGCEGSEECPDGHACADDGDGTYCKRPPTGQGAPCVSADDCAGFEASYCETIQLRVCLVEGCAVSPDSCHVGWTCCDLSALGLDQTLCVPDGQCPTR